VYSQLVRDRWNDLGWPNERMGGFMSAIDERTRRRFLKEAIGVGAALTIATRNASATANEKTDDDDVSPTEDLMREHGVLRRLLLVYGEVIRRVDANQEVKPEPVAHSAQIIRVFIEDYHERDEEEFIFPRFQKAGKLTELVAVLLQQHQAGRKLTATIERLATTAAMKSSTSRHEMTEAMRQFIRMYEPHAAREDTVLFPAFAKLVGEKELHRLQETFEQKEKALPLGDFEKMVTEVENIEKALGIHDLALFTPHPKP
jgi:hemerythrin-like domain-containing protein